MQSITHFNMFANSAEPTRLLLGKTHRAHDVARSNRDGLCHEPDTLFFSADALVNIRAMTAPFDPESPTVSLTTRMSEKHGSTAKDILTPAVIRHRSTQATCQPPQRQLNWGS